MVLCVFFATYLHWFCIVFALIFITFQWFLSVFFCGFSSCFAGAWMEFCTFFAVFFQCFFDFLLHGSLQCFLALGTSIVANKTV